MEKYVCIDMGASETRFSSGLSAEHEAKTIPNSMIEVGIDEDIRVEPATRDPYDCLDVTIRKEGLSVEDTKYFYDRVLIGELAKKYTGAPERPTGMVSKVDQKINYTSAIVATAMSLIRDGNVGEVGNVDMFVVLPPLEVKNKHEVFESRVKGSYTVIFNKMNKVVKFRVAEVKCYAESQAAIISFLFNRNGTLTSEAQRFKEGCILSMDIGASTTDLVVIENLKYNERTGQTYKNGGNICITALKGLIEGNIGLYYDDPTIEEILKSGRRRSGNKFVDASDLVKKAKQAYARDIVNEIQNYFRTIAMPIQNMRAIVVSGGGSMPSGYTDESGEFVETVPAMSEFITEKLLQVCPDIEVITMQNPRYANIEGIERLAQFAMARARG